MLTNAYANHASTTVSMFEAVILVVVIHVTLKLVPDVNCDSAALVVHVIATVQ